MLIYPQVEAFLKHYCPSASPLLLALSGGADSLCLFYCLLDFRSRCGVPFHIGHVDHGWREESGKEALALQKLAEKHQVPFHLKTLDPTQLKGNLEAACREERYSFFAELSLQQAIQAILTGHHQNDQAETVFKRILEGAPWSRWSGLQPEIWIKGARILRPLLKVLKKDIQQDLAQENISCFDDPTNRQLCYLRSRFRESLFPKLNEEFGKEVQQSFIEISEEAEDLKSYFERKLSPLLAHVHRGHWGAYFDFQKNLPPELLEIKFLLRLMGDCEGFYLSRRQIEQAAAALQKQDADVHFSKGGHQIRIDRGRIFSLSSPFNHIIPSFQELSLGKRSYGNWMVSVVETVYYSEKASSWKEGWSGTCMGYLPMGNYSLGFLEKENDHPINKIAVKKQWSQAKVPAFLYNFFPVVWQKDEICHEFLSGKRLIPLKEGERCMAIGLKFEENF